VGGLLRETRKRAGVGIADVARALRISQKYLEALEEDRHADLPGAAYAIGFVRSYGEHLHLDGEEVVRRYKVEAAGLNGKKDLVFPKPMSDRVCPVARCWASALSLQPWLMGCGFGTPPGMVSMRRGLKAFQNTWRR